MGKIDFGDKMRDLVDIFGRREIKLSDDEIDELWKIDSEKAARTRRRAILWRSISVAAAACVLFAVFAWRRTPATSRLDSIELYALNERPASDSELTDVMLIMADRTEMNVGGAESDIDYTVKGKIVVDSDTIDENSDDSAPRFNQLIVPYGRRTRLRLSDGTCVHVNSGTRVVYPLSFGTGDRTVFIEGEAYFEVAKDSDRPFIVKTGNVSVRVLGTKFNVFAYHGENPNVVLVEGSVDVSTSGAKRRMKPGQKVEALGDVLGEPEKVNVESYISWTKNELVYDNEPLSSVFSRLETYYGISFDIRCDISRMYVSGRLLLAENPADVLSSISFSVPVDLSSDNSVVTVTSR